MCLKKEALLENFVFLLVCRPSFYAFLYWDNVLKLNSVVLHSKHALLSIDCIVPHFIQIHLLLLDSVAGYFKYGWYKIVSPHFKTLSYCGEHITEFIFCDGFSFDSILISKAYGDLSYSYLQYPNCYGKQKHCFYYYRFP